MVIHGSKRNRWDVGRGGISQTVLYIRESTENATARGGLSSLDNGEMEKGEPGSLREGRPGTSRTMGGIMGGYFGIDHLGVQSRLQCRITSPIIASVAHQKFQNCPAWISSSLRHYSNKALCEQAHCNATPRRKMQGPGGTLRLSPFFTANKKASRMLIEIDDIRSPACWMEKGKAAKAKGR